MVLSVECRTDSVPAPFKIPTLLKKSHGKTIVVEKANHEYIILHHDYYY